jgi:hypothetical protein
MQCGTGRLPLGWKPFVRSSLRRGCTTVARDVDPSRIDPFKPKKRYPEGVYKWSNWVLACPFWNNSKGEQWPVQDFVNPCESSAAGRPESHFAFDTLTGEMLARPGLPSSRCRRALNTRDLIKLNNYHHLKKRMQRLALIGIALENSPAKSGRDALIAEVMRPDRELYSITGQYLEERVYAKLAL